MSARDEARKRAQELRDAIPNAVGDKRDRLRWDAALLDRLAAEIAAAEERAHTLEVECRDLQQRLGQQEDNARAAEERAATAEARLEQSMEQSERAVAQGNTAVAGWQSAADRVGVLEDALRRIASEDRLDRSGFSHVRQFALAALSGPRGVTGDTFRA